MARSASARGIEGECVRAAYLDPGGVLPSPRELDASPALCVLHEAPASVVDLLERHQVVLGPGESHVEDTCLLQPVVVGRAEGNEQDRVELEALGAMNARYNHATGPALEQLVG